MYTLLLLSLFLCTQAVPASKKLDFSKTMVEFQTRSHVPRWPGDLSAKGGGRCGGIAGFPCPQGFKCKIPKGDIVADAMGTCVPV